MIVLEKQFDTAGGPSPTQGITLTPEQGPLEFSRTARPVKELHREAPCKQET
jgi:hypothetical protein